MSDEAAFLEALRANPADDTTRLVYADWLDERDRPREAEYLRLTVALTDQSTYYEKYAEQSKRLVAVGEGLSEEWRSAAGGRFDLQFVQLRDRAQTITAIKAVRELTGSGLAEMKALVETLPQRVFGWLPFDSAVAFREYLVAQLSSAIIRIDDSTQESSPYPKSFDIVASRAFSNPPVGVPAIQPGAAEILQAFFAGLPLSPAMAEGPATGGQIILATEVPAVELVRRFGEVRALAASRGTPPVSFYLRPVPTT